MIAMDLTWDADIRGDLFGYRRQNNSAKPTAQAQPQRHFERRIYTTHKMNQPINCEQNDEFSAF